MKIKFLLTKIFLIFLFLSSNVQANKSEYFLEGKKLFEKNDFEKSKIFFERDIVFNPKNEISYLYLAKIYNNEKNRIKEEKNLNTVILLDPKNEEAIFMLMEIELKKSNYSEVRELIDNFSKICKNLCDKQNSILDSLKNLEPKNES